MKRNVTAILLSAAMALGLAGCGSTAVKRTGSPETSGSVVTETTSGTGSAISGEETAASDGGDLNVMIETPVEGLDPQTTEDGTSFEVIADYMDGLMQMDKNGDPVPAIAESYEKSSDGLTWTFHLRRDAKWSNGTPVTAKDFVFAWRRAVDPDTAAIYSYMLSDIGQIRNAADIIAGRKDKSELGVAAKNDHTLVVTLNAPISHFLNLMYFPAFYPVNEDFYKSCNGTYGSSPDTILSDGAFVIDDYKPAANSIHMKKNENYYDKDRIRLSGIRYSVIPDSQAALMSYQNGDLDLALINGDQIDQVRDDPDYRSFSSGYMWYIAPNISGVKELQNLNLRLAMTMAINRASICSDVCRDGSVPTYTAVPVNFATGPDGKPFSEDQSRYSGVCAYDTTKAAAYWKKGLDELGINSLELTMKTDADDKPQKVAQAIKEELEAALPGLTINLEPESKKQRLQDMYSGNFDLGLTRWAPDYDDPMAYLGTWKTGVTCNYGRFSDSTYDSLLDECATGDLARNQQGRWDALYKAEDIIMNNAVVFPLYTQCSAEMIKSNVRGVEFHPVAINRVYKDAVKTAE